MIDLPSASGNTHLTHTYLGNRSNNPQLAEQLANAAYLEVILDPGDCAKGRIYTQTTQGEPIGITKDRHWTLADGDVMQTTTGQMVLIHLQPQTVMVLRIEQSLPADQALALIHLGHTLGNHHWPISVEPDKIYIHLAAEKTVIEKTLQSFQIPGLSIEYELRSPTQPLHFSTHSHHP